MKKPARIFIGTSGWVYRHWKDVFYPPELKSSDWLGFYMEHFSTVEINNTFYHLPPPSAFRLWHRSAKKGFIYALKGSRFITHMKKLKDAQKPLEMFLGRAGLLGENLGPILFQLPPRWHVNTERLRAFVDMLPEDRRFVFEFRDSSWFIEPVYSILAQRSIGLCIYHMPGFTTPFELTAPFSYIRFHGSGTLYGGRYSKKDLAKWAERIKGLVKSGVDVYIYFNNDAMGNAVINAKELRAMVETI